MLLFTKDAEQKLCEMLPIIKRQVSGMHAFIISGCDFTYNELIKNKLPLTVRAAAEQSGQIDGGILFFFKNGLIIFIAKERRQGTLLRASQNILQMFTEKNGIRGTVKHFDLNAVWDSFSELCMKELMESQAKAGPSNIKTDINMLKTLSKSPEVDEIMIKMSAIREKRESTRILFVDDDTLTRALLAGSLGNTRGYEVLTASNVEDALETYIFNAPDIVFLDINLPSVNGIAFLEIIRSMDFECYIVMLSSASSRTNVQSSMDSGAEGFLTKPFSKEHLEFHIARCKEVKDQWAL